LILGLLSIEYHLCRLYFAYPAIKQLALSRLKTATDSYFTNIQKQQTGAISISYRADQYSEVVYVSNVAFVFSKILNIPPLEIATDLASFYIEFPVRQQDFIITVIPPGFLSLKLTEIRLAQWLQCLPLLPLSLANLPPLGDFNPSANNLDLFTIQYACARCYSLMQLAQREGLITLEEISVERVRSMFPDLIIASCETSILIINQPLHSWLRYGQQLPFCHRTEYVLIIHLVKVVDDFCSSTQFTLDDWAKSALKLSHAFADFYSHCRIFDETNIQTPNLVSGRLNLILATYVVLKLLLQRLGIFAPRSL
jgi:DALR anticodon binding domain